jgi:hypothetical protein
MVGVIDGIEVLIRGTRVGDDSIDIIVVDVE